VRPEELIKLKKKLKSSDLDPAAFWFVALCLNHYASACPQEDFKEEFYSPPTGKSSGYAVKFM
jgi:hypothetical protein